jgi:uncharacterized membrane protein
MKFISDLGRRALIALDGIDLRKLAPLLGIVIGLSFYSGAPLKPSILIAVTLYLLIKSWVSSQTLYRALIVIAVAYPIFLTALQVAYFLTGYQGIDFGIFTQVIFQVAETNTPRSSLISTEWQNFLTHHFSPYLLILGWIARIGVSPACLLIACHFLAVTALAVGLYKIGRTHTEDHSRAILVTLTVLLMPAVRVGLSWETHDEILALPFLIWSLYAHFTGRGVVKLLLLIPALLFNLNSAVKLDCICPSS